MLEWLLTVTAPWSSELKKTMLHVAALDNHLIVVQWLKAHGADWLKSFSVKISQAGSKERQCWHISVVRWALDSGSGWLDWKCKDYDADKYADAYFKQQAAELLEYAHANGCPCTCGHVQQLQLR
jgi:hypothetical protein